MSFYRKHFNNCEINFIPNFVSIKTKTKQNKNKTKQQQKQNKQQQQPKIHKIIASLNAYFIPLFFINSHQLIQTEIKEHINLTLNSIITYLETSSVSSRFLSLIAEKGSFRSSAICTSLLLLFSVFPATRK